MRILLLIFLITPLFAGDDVGNGGIGDKQLGIIPISQYTCFIKNDRRDPYNTTRLHFYYNSHDTPEPVPTNPYYFCHDFENLGEMDRPTFPRLETIPKVFSLWDGADTRFWDLDGDGNLDINQIIEDQIEREFGLVVSLDLFKPLKWDKPLRDWDKTHLGFVMRPFINPKTGKAKCPTQKDYNGNDPLFIVLGRFLGFDTEAIYLGKKEKKNITRRDGTTFEAPTDYLLMREDLLDEIWWSMDGNIQNKSDETSLMEKPIYYYYPANPHDPFNRRSYQELYSLKNEKPLNSDYSQDELPYGDKRIGCIPKN